MKKIFLRIMLLLFFPYMYVLNFFDCIFNPEDSQPFSVLYGLWKQLWDDVE